jgi:hypothetical protein
VANDDEPIDWQVLAREIGVDPNSGGDGIARLALAALLGASRLHTAVDWYVDYRPAAEHSRSVLWLLRPVAARDRCLEIYRTDANPQRRRAAVELLRVVATADDLPLVTEFLADTDRVIQDLSLQVLDQLIFGQYVDEQDAEPYLRVAESHTNPDVRARCSFIREYWTR